MTSISMDDFLASCGLKGYLQKFLDEGFDLFEDIEELDEKELANDFGMDRGEIARFIRKRDRMLNDDIDACESKEKTNSKYPERRDWAGYKKVPRTKNKSDYSRTNKVIIVIGETGSGKTTLLNSMYNYLFDVEFEDKFRFKLINEEAIINDANRNQAHGSSVTSDVTAYDLSPTNPKVNYDLTVIDTPGFGHTRALGMDEQTRDKIKAFFQTKKRNTVTGVCLVMKATTTRLTATQKYIFSTFKDLFGEDISDNIFVLVTFCDAKRPPCIRALKAANTQYKQLFKFNNSAFVLDEDVAQNDDDDEDSYGFENEDEDDRAFEGNLWKMGMKSFEKLFAAIGRTPDKALGMPKNVPEQRVYNAYQYQRVGNDNEPGPSVDEGCCSCLSKLWECLCYYCCCRCCR